MKTIQRTVLCLLAAGCTPPVPDQPTYDGDVAPILQANCIRCHEAPTAGVNDARNCFRLDVWDDTPDTDDVCPDSDVIAGVHTQAMDVVAQAAHDMTMPPAQPLTERQRDILDRWETAGYPRRSGNSPPTIEFITPPVGGVTVDQSYDVQYVVSDPDGDTVTWTLGWQGNSRTGVFATAIPGGQGTITIDTSVLAAGTYTLTAVLYDGSSADGVSIVSDRTITIAAGRDAAPTVTVVDPNGGEVYREGSGPVTIKWIADDPDSPMLDVDVVALGGGGMVTIGTAVPSPNGTETSTTWDITGVAFGSDYRISVTVHDRATPDLTATDLSDATFTLAPPPQDVSFATQLQPILTGKCTGIACHDATMPAQSLNLTSAAAYGELVGPNSTECTTTKIVDPGSPDTSYLIWKLDGGGGSCFLGSRMPKIGAALTSSQILLFRDWITNGAPNN